MKLWQFALVGVAVVIGVICAIDAIDTIDKAEEQVGEAAREQVARQSFWDISEVKVVTVKGYEYIIVNGSNRGGIVHSESCPCKESGVSK